MKLSARVLSLLRWKRIGVQHRLSLRLAHWKTARTALNRIHEAFSKRKLKPHTFFIGAAIETNMATEIWEMLKRGSLENAANLTDEDQVTSVSQWLCTL